MLIVAYKLNDTIVGRYNGNETTCNAILIIIVTFIIIGINVTWIAY
jgi:hypothetical protein